MFQELLLNASARGGETGNFFGCELFEYPPSISLIGNLRFGTKSDITNILLEYQTSSKHSFPPGIQCAVYDAAVKVQCLQVTLSVKTFIDYKHHFYSDLRSTTTSISRVDLVFDRYLDNSLKSKRGSGSSASISFKPQTVIPRNWHAFLFSATRIIKLLYFHTYLRKMTALFVMSIGIL